MKHTVTVFRGDGIGPELVDNVLKILEAAKAPCLSMRSTMSARMSGRETVP